MPTRHPGSSVMLGPAGAVSKNKLYPGLQMATNKNSDRRCFLANADQLQKRLASCGQLQTTAVFGCRQR